jgi:hypothetical protein
VSSAAPPLDPAPFAVAAASFLRTASTAYSLVSEQSKERAQSTRLALLSQRAAERVHNLA